MPDEKKSILTHLDPDGRARMVDVGDKPVTRRTATAGAAVHLNAAAAEAVAANTLAKGNTLEVARLAGIAAAKRTDQLIPLCHSLPLDAADVIATLDGRTVRLTATASTSWKTGVEMEALTAAAVAALTVIDMVKSLDPAVTVTDLRLLEKTGGKRGHWTPPRRRRLTARGAATMPDPTAAILTVSDRAAAGLIDDRSGPAAAVFVEQHLGLRVVDAAVVPDESDAIHTILRRWLDQAVPPRLILTTGGTGLGPRDITPEAVAPLIERRADALLELARLRCLPDTPEAYLSRGVAGVVGQTLILTLPGSPRAVTQLLGHLADRLPHALRLIAGHTEHPA